MGVLLAYADWRLAAYLGAGGAMLAAMLVLFLVQPCPVAHLPGTEDETPSLGFAARLSKTGRAWLYICLWHPYL